MHWGFRFWGIRGGFGIERCRMVTGINSIIADGGHVLFWDFDEAELADVEEALAAVQEIWHLPRIVILRSSAAKHFHAMCLYRVPIEAAASILLLTFLVDHGWVGRGIARGYWTLRVSPRDGKIPTLVSVLPSPVPEDVHTSELQSVDEYWEAVR